MQSAIEMTKPRSTAVTPPFSESFQKLHETSKLCQTKRLKGLQFAFVIGYSTPRKDGLQKPHKWHGFLQIWRPGHQSNEGPPFVLLERRYANTGGRVRLDLCAMENKRTNVQYQFPWNIWCKRPSSYAPFQNVHTFFGAWLHLNQGGETLIKPKAPRIRPSHPQITYIESREPADRQSGIAQWLMIDDSEIQLVFLRFFIVHGFQLGSHVVKGDLWSDWNQEHKKELSKSMQRMAGSL